MTLETAEDGEPFGSRSWLGITTFVGIARKMQRLWIMC